MAKNKRKRSPKTVLKLPDLEQSRSAVLNSLTSLSSQRSYDHAIREFIEWYCSEPRLAFNKTVVTRCKLDPKSRARLAGRLLDSLDELSEEENAQLWAEEAQRRDAQMDAHPDSGRPAADVFRKGWSRIK